MGSPRQDLERLKRKLTRRMMSTVGEFSLINPGDRIMVAVSGGKDSYTLLDLLSRARARSPFPFELVAVHLDQMQPGYDGQPLRDWLETCEEPYEILQRLLVGWARYTSTFCHYSYRRVADFMVICVPYFPKQRER